MLELVQTTTHFKMLKLAAIVGGAGGRNLDSLVEEIYVNFEEGIRNIKESNLVSMFYRRRIARELTAQGSEPTCHL